MAVLLFLIGILLGVVVGAAICIRYLKQEMTARIGPTMDLLRLQLDNVQGAVNLALANWHAELHDHSTPRSQASGIHRDRSVVEFRREDQGELG